MIRLADRRGVLRGRSFSRVQVWALNIVMLWEQIEEDRKRFDDRFTALRAQLVTTPVDQVDLARVKKLFPEFFPEPKKEEVVVYDVTEEELLDTTGKWQFGQSTTDADEIEAVLRSMGQTTRVTLEDDFDEGGWV